MHEKQDTDRYGNVAVAVPPAVGTRYRAGGLLVLGDSPGFYETLGKQRGKPLVGKPGELFEALAAEAGIARDDLVLDYMVRHRPPNNRLKDYPEATLACSHWTNIVMATYQPKVVIVFGSESVKHIFGETAGVQNTRGTLNATPPKHPWGHRLVIATYHPSAAIYAGGAQSEVGRQIVQDLRTARNALWALEGIELGEH